MQQLNVLQDTAAMRLPVLALLGHVECPEIRRDF